jgi:hypothetical protein
MSKAEHERAVFTEFVIVAGLDVPLASIKSQEPPLPDIACTLAGAPHMFELTRVADQEIANDVGMLLTKASRTGEGGVGGAHSYDDKAILRRAVERKATARHVTQGAPLSLLAYYDGVFHELGSFDWVRATFEQLVEEYAARWHSMWLFDWPKKALLRSR